MPRLVIPPGHAPISIPRAGMTLVMINDEVGRFWHAVICPQEFSQVAFEPVSCRVRRMQKSKMVTNGTFAGGLWP